MKYILFTTLIGLILFSSIVYAPPVWSNPSSGEPIYYDPFFFTRHQIQWMPNPFPVSTVLIEIDWSGIFQNYTMLPHGGIPDLFEYNIILPAGGFCWASWANDLAARWNYTVWDAPGYWCYAIQKKPTTANLYLNGTAGNVTYNIGDIANFSTLTSNVSGIGDANVYYINLTSDYPLVNASNNSWFLLNQEHVMGNPGTYWLNASFSGNQNYTSSEQTYYFTISSAVAPVTRSISILLIIIFVIMIGFGLKYS